MTGLSWPWTDWVLAALGVISLVTFLGGLLLVPVIVARLPADHFQRDRPSPPPHRHPLLHLALVAAKNLVGLLVVLAGIAMLVLPGQGILTILVGLAVMDFPRKHGLERAIVSRRAVLRGLNWIRVKAGQPPFTLKPSPPPPSPPPAAPPPDRPSA